MPWRWRDGVPRSFELEILGARTRQVGIEMNAVGLFRHERFGEAHRPAAVVVFEDCAIGVAAGVGGIVVGAVVVDRPVEELEVAVGAPGIEVEKVREAEFSDAKFDPPRG